MNRFRDWLRNFHFAYEGLLYALTSQRNMKFHFMAAFMVVMSALVLRVEKWDVLFILMAITLVIVTELINTAVEKTVDLAMPERHPLAKIAKDAAAAAVLVSALFALAVGMIVFYGPVVDMLHGIRGKEKSVNASNIWLFASLVLLGLVAIHARFARYTRRSGWRPSMMSALAFSVATIMLMLADNGLSAMLALILAAITTLVLFEKTERSFLSLVLGALTGAVITVMAFLLIWL